MDDTELTGRRGLQIFHSTPVHSTPEIFRNPHSRKVQKSYKVAVAVRPIQRAWDARGFLFIHDPRSSGIFARTSSVSCPRPQMLDRATVTFSTLLHRSTCFEE